MSEGSHSSSSSLSNDGGRVFVSIASYRDPELIPTVADCLNNARHPERLRFCICWQHGDDERLPDWFGGDQFVVLDVDWRRSRGSGWARALIMDLWDGEEWFLLLDSHHRFVPDWDIRVLEQVRATESPKPLITTYGVAYSPGDAERPPDQATRIDFDRFTDEGDFLMRPGLIRDDEGPRPRRARFLSAHFLFAPGRFVDEVPFDPDLYFTGVESTLTVRSFTHGYDLFHPGVPIIAHEYSRDYRTKHWEDHQNARGAALEWHESDALSKAKIRTLFTNPFVGYYGLGDQRTLAEYEAYAGISFAHRRIQDYTRLHLEPPNPPVDPDWAQPRGERGDRVLI